MFTFVTICPCEDNMIYIAFLYHSLNCKIVSLVVTKK